jgi:predicted nuclease with TOPRIM domain
MAKTRITLASIHKEIKQLATKDQLASTNDQLASTNDQLAALTVFVRSSFLGMSAKLDEHSQELKGLRERVDTLHGLMENLLVRTERLEQEYTMITAGLKRLETRFDDLDAVRLRQRIDALEKRVTALESVGH